MKILLVNKFHYRRGGAEVVYLHTADLLRAAGHDVVFFSMKHPENEPVPNETDFVESVDYPTLRGPVRMLREAARSIYSREARRRLATLLARERPDIAHLHNYYFHLSPSILYALRDAGVPVVHTLHDYHLECPNHGFYDYRREAICEDCPRYGFHRVVTNACMKVGRAKSIVAFLEAWIYHRFGAYRQRVDRYIAPSEFLRSKISRACIPQEKITVLRNTVEDLGPPASEPDSLPTFFYAGRLSHEKGLPLIAEVAARLPETRWRLAGTGPLEEDLRRRIGQRELRNVELMGTCNPARLKQEYARATAAILPSVWFENCPLTILEAMSAGRPVIGSRIGGIAELVREGKTGWLFEVGSAADFERVVRRVLESPGTVEEAGTTARKTYLRNFSPETYLNGLLGIYEGVIADRRGESVSGAQET